MTETILFDGMKATRIDDLPASAWTWYTPHVSGDEKDIEQYYRAVPLIFSGVDLIANTVAALPFAIVNEAGGEVDTSDDYQNALGFLPNPIDWRFLIAASMELMGQAYLFRLRNDIVTKGLRYMLTKSIEPIIDEKEGLVGFTRQLSTGKMLIPVEDMIYFWGRDPYTEIGPPKEGKCPGQAALIAAGVLYNLGNYASAYFERGAIRPMIMTVPGAKPQGAELSKLKAWLRKFLLGINNAWTTQIFEEGTKFENVGDGIGELSDSDLTQEQREDILAALRIPITVFYSNQAGGLGGGGVVTSDEKKFYEQKIIPAARFISTTLNEQLLVPMGYRWIDRPETLDVFQTDENQRSQSFERYVNTGLRRSLTAQMLGLELPAGVEYADLDTQYEEDKEAAAARMPDFGNTQPNPQGTQQQAKALRDAMAPELTRAGQALDSWLEPMMADLGRWERKALAKGADCEFESVAIPTDVQIVIGNALGVANTDEEIKAAFRGPFRQAAERWDWDYP